MATRPDLLGPSPKRPTSKLLHAWLGVRGEACLTALIDGVFKTVTCLAMK